MDEVASGRYRPVELIGEGGMGQVFKAHDTKIGRDVAIKVLPPEMGALPGYRERFRREAQVAARLTEPHNHSHPRHRRNRKVERKAIALPAAAAGR